MTTVQDNFQRANGSIGPNYTIAVGAGATDSIQLLNDAFASSSVLQQNFPSAFGIWNAAIFGPNQFSSVKLAAIAPSLSTVAITGCVQSAGNTTYTYTLSTGSALVNPQEMIIAGMSNAGNNGAFLITALGSGTFTVANPSGVTESGSSGTGNSPVDSLCGPVVRGGVGSLNGYWVYIGNNSGYVAMDNGTVDNRVYVYELWKIVNGTPSDLSEIEVFASIPDSVGDVFHLFALGNKIAFYKNKVLATGSNNPVVVDNSLASGAPGIMASSATGAGSVITPTQPLGANLGISGTQFTDFIGSDAPSTPSGWVAKWTENFANPSTASTYSQWTNFTGTLTFPSGGSHQAEVVFLNTSMIATQRTWANDQAAQATMGLSTGNTSQSLLLRASTTAETAYLIQFVFTNGDGAGTLNIYKFIAGTATLISTTSSATLGFSDTFRAEIVGSNITVKINGTTVLTGTDSTLTSGYPAMGPGGGSSFVLNWEADEVATSQAATPTFNPPAGAYSGAQLVTISSTTPSAQVYYTTDGSTPTTSSTAYTGPVSVTSGTLKAIVTAGGFLTSSVGSAAYTQSNVYSQPDCRVAPNGFITVNLTKTYTVQISDNAAIPPVDSRAVGAPVASNVAYPQNSRTPGTFGPNE